MHALFIIGYFLHFHSANLGREAEQIDEALSIVVIVQIACLE